MKCEHPEQLHMHISASAEFEGAVVATVGSSLEHCLSLSQSSRDPGKYFQDGRAPTEMEVAIYLKDCAKWCLSILEKYIAEHG